MEVVKKSDLQKKEFQKMTTPPVRSLKFSLKIKITMMLFVVLILTVSIISHFIIRRQTNLLTEEQNTALEIYLRTFKKAVEPAFQGETEVNIPKIQEFIYSYTNIPNFKLAQFVDNLGYSVAHLYLPKYSGYPIEKFLGLQISGDGITTLWNAYQDRLYLETRDFGTTNPAGSKHGILPIYHPLKNADTNLSTYFELYREKNLFRDKFLSAQIRNNNQFVRVVLDTYNRYFDGDNYRELTMALLRQNKISLDDLNLLSAYHAYFEDYRDGKELIVFRYALEEFIEALKRLNGLSNTEAQRYLGFKQEGNLFSGDFSLGMAEITLSEEDKNNRKLIRDFGYFYRRYYDDKGQLTTRAQSQLTNKQINSSDLRVLKRFKRRFSRYEQSKTKAFRRFGLGKGALKRLLGVLGKMGLDESTVNKYRMYVDKNYVFHRKFSQSEIGELDYNERLMRDFYTYYEKIYDGRKLLDSAKDLIQAQQVSDRDLLTLRKFDSQFRAYKRGDDLVFSSKDLTPLFDALAKLGMPVKDGTDYMKLADEKKMFSGKVSYDVDGKRFRDEADNNLKFTEQIASLCYNNHRLRAEWYANLENAMSQRKDLITQRSNIVVKLADLKGQKQKNEMQIELIEKELKKVNSDLVEWNKLLVEKKALLEQMSWRAAVYRYQIIISRRTGVYYLEHEEWIQNHLKDYLTLLRDIGFKGSDEKEWNSVLQKPLFMSKNLLSEENRRSLRFAFDLEDFVSKFVDIRPYPLNPANGNRYVYTLTPQFEDYYFVKDSEIMRHLGNFLVPYNKQFTYYNDELFLNGYNIAYRDYYKRIFINLAKSYAEEVNPYLYYGGEAKYSELEEIFKNWFGLYRVGSVRIILDNTEISRKQKEIVNSTMDIAIMFILRMLALSFIVVAILVTPLRKLGEESSRLGQTIEVMGHELTRNSLKAKDYLLSGALDRKIEIKTSDEIGQFSDQFNNMLKRIRLAFGEMIEKARMETELGLAEKIQRALMPPVDNLPQIPGREISVYYEPEYESGGDYYDFIENVDEQTFGFVVADVTNHGVNAAMVMAVLRSALRTAAEKGAQPASVLKYINPILVRDAPTDMFATAFYATMNIKNNEMIYSVAGHEEGIIYNPSEGKIKLLQKGGMPVGVMNSEIFDPLIKQFKITLNKGDYLILYSDGITEAKSKSDEEYGDERFYATIKKYTDDDLNKMRDRIIMDLKKFTVIEEFVFEYEALISELEKGVKLYLSEPIRDKNGKEVLGFRDALNRADLQNLAKTYPNLQSREWKVCSRAEQSDDITLLIMKML